VADHPLRPATDRRLGRLLPYQLANQTQAPPIAPGLTPAFLRRVYAVLARVSSGYPPLQGRFLRVTHPSATRHPTILLWSVLPFDLHVLSMPPAFNLSQDQTLHFISWMLNLCNSILSHWRFLARDFSHSKFNLSIYLILAFNKLRLDKVPTLIAWFQFLKNMFSTTVLLFSSLSASPEKRILQPPVLKSTLFLKDF
jgi:hypothetical protein